MRLRAEAGGEDEAGPAMSPDAEPAMSPEAEPSADAPPPSG
jgi:hypothetical protein